MIKTIIKDTHETEIPTRYYYIFKNNINNKIKKNFIKLCNDIMNFIFLFSSSIEEYIYSSLFKENKKNCLKILNDIYSRQLRNNYIKKHNTKNRSETNYSTKKLWKQKGTGRARIGSKNSPILRGGGIIFGPKYNNIKLKINKKIKKKLIKNLFFLQRKKIKLIDKDIDISKLNKTKELLNYLNFNLIKDKILILVSNDIEDKISIKLKLLLNNVVNIQIVNVNNLKIKHLLINKKIFILENSLFDLIPYLLKEK